MYCDFSTGGLKIGSLAGKNLALLAKWWWRYRIEKHKLWARLITSIYGEAGGFGVSSLSSFRGTWSDIIQAGRDINAVGIDFEKTFSRSIGRGNSVRF